MFSEIRVRNWMVAHSVNSQLTCGYAKKEVQICAYLGVGVATAVRLEES